MTEDILNVEVTSIATNQRASTGTEDIIEDMLVVIVEDAPLLYLRCPSEPWNYSQVRDDLEEG